MGSITAPCDLSLFSPIFNITLYNTLLLLHIKTLTQTFLKPTMVGWLDGHELDNKLYKASFLFLLFLNLIINVWGF